MTSINGFSSSSETLRAQTPLTQRPSMTDHQSLVRPHSIDQSSSRQHTDRFDPTDMLSKAIDTLGFLGGKLVGAAMSIVKQLIPV